MTKNVYVACSWADFTMGRDILLAIQVHDRLVSLCSSLRPIFFETFLHSGDTNPLADKENAAHQRCRPHSNLFGLYVPCWTRHIWRDHLRPRPPAGAPQQCVRSLCWL